MRIRESIIQILKWGVFVILIMLLPLSLLCLTWNADCVIVTLMRLFCFLSITGSIWFYMIIIRILLMETRKFLLLKRLVEYQRNRVE